jgi:hypothetical protein
MDDVTTSPSPTATGMSRLPSSVLIEPERYGGIFVKHLFHVCKHDTTEHGAETSGSIF